VESVLQATPMKNLIFATNTALGGSNSKGSNESHSMENGNRIALHVPLGHIIAVLNTSQHVLIRPGSVDLLVLVIKVIYILTP
jgi:hypothetical protein